MLKSVILSVGILLAGIAAPQLVHARLGVGVGTGKIQVDERLQPGGIYALPPISVFNTGDRTAEYQMTVTFHEDQTEFRPKAEWFHFTPERFELAPGEAQAVEIEMNMPLRVEPGDYFAYLEAGPLETAEDGMARIAVAAATKLNFSVEAANMWWAAYYKAAAWWRELYPWSYIGLGVVSVSLIGYYLHRRYTVQPRRVKL